MVPIQVRLPLCRPAGTDDAHGIVVAFGVDDQNDAPHNRTDGDEAILVIRVQIVEDLQVVIPSREENTCFLERDAMLFLIGAVLGVIPDDPPCSRLSQGRTKSMA